MTAFKGIRYGADTSAYRFQPPRPPEPWTQPANAFAFAFGPTCPQDPPLTSVDRAENPGLVMMGLTDNLPESEDCLFLNVWTPVAAVTEEGWPGGHSPHSEGWTSSGPAPSSSDPDTGADGTASPAAGQAARSGRPVLVWVHSGGYAANSGSSPSVDGAHLAAAEDLVVVSFNHRLGVLGYTQVVDPATHPDSPYTASGNVGHLDIVAALEWVRDNIAAFGGDPDNVTLAGQSGGAMKISGLLAMPAAQPLFRRAILQSGTCVHVLEVPEALETGRRLREQAGLAPDCGPEELASQPLTDLMTAYCDLAAGAMTAFGPAHLACLRRDAGEGTAPTYRYRNVLRTDAADSALGSTHELDVALTFGNVEAAVGLNGGTGEARATSAVLGRAWAAFARTGVPDLGEAGPWPAWDAAERHVALLGAHPRVAQDVDGPSLDVAARLGDEQLLNWFGMLLG